VSEGQKKLGIFVLVGLVVGSAVGSGIFNASANIARAGAAGPALIGWLIVGAGLLCLVLCISNVVDKKPQLNSIVEYAEAGFGKFWGLISGWGYWLSTMLGNVAYAALLLSAFGNFINVLHLTNNAGPGGMDVSNILPVVFISLVMWLLYLIVNRGVEQAVFTNAIVLIAKLVPLTVVLIAGIIAFKAEVFSAHFWENMASNLDNGEAVPVYDQIKGCFLVMIWCFVGIEGASVFSSRAKEKKDAARATVLGFFALILIYVMLSMVPFGVLSQAELAGLGEPALAYVLERIVGPWGAVLVNLGLIISLTGAWLAWTLLPTETQRLMADRGYLPARFGKLNKNGAPTFALTVTSLCIQVFIVSFLFPDFKVKGMTSYDFAFTLASSANLITWLFAAFYNTKLSFTEKGTGWQRSLAIGILASAFLLWMVIEVGLVYILLSFVTYIPAFFLFIRARKAAGEIKPVTPAIGIWMYLIGIGAVVSVVLLATNVISL
jgi:arginine:ornithine antiporter/lysine permease